jgi:hypothetical protein
MSLGHSYQHVEPKRFSFWYGFIAGIGVGLLFID